MKPDTNKSSTTEEQTESHRLKDVVKLSGFTREEFANKYNISLNTLKSYLENRSRVPLDLAKTLSNEYGVSLDWLYCNSDFMCNIDVVLCALSKLLKTESVAKISKINGEIYPYGERTLYMDSRLHDFLLAMQELKNIKETSYTITEEEYQARWMATLKRFNDELKDVFIADDFFQENKIEFDYLEFLD